MHSYPGSGAAAKTRRVPELVGAVVIVLVLIVGLLSILGVEVAGRALPEWFRSWLPEQEEEMAEHPEVSGSEAPNDAVAKQAIVIGQMNDALGRLTDEMDRIAEIRQEVETALVPGDEAEESVSDAERQRRTEVRADLEALAAALGNAREEVEFLEREMSSLTPQQGVVGGIGRILPVLLTTFAVVGLAGFLFYYFRGRRGSGSAEVSRRREHPSAEDRISRSEENLEALNAPGRQTDGSAPLAEEAGPWIKQLENKIAALEKETSSLRSDLEQAHSRINDLEKQRHPGGPGPDSQLYGGSTPQSTGRPSHPPSAAAPPSGPAGRFQGPVREIRNQLPTSAQTMEFAPTHELLVRKLGSTGKKFKVFQDNQSRSYKVIPLVDSARYQDELAWLKKVFDVQWNGGGEVKLLSDPTLEPTSEGFKIRSKGQISVG